MSLLTTAQVATQLAMSQEWVRDHAGELGGIRAGSGPRAPLRFHPDSINAWVDAHRIASAPVAPPAPRRKKTQAQLPAGVSLLPTPPRELLFTNG